MTSMPLIWLICGIAAIISIIIHIKVCIKTEDFTLITLIVLVIFIILANIFLLKVFEAIEDNNGKIAVSYIAEATVIAVGYQGVTVEYYDEEDGYGEKTAATAKITTEKEKYQIGDTVTIQVDKNVFFNPTTTVKLTDD